MIEALLQRFKFQTDKLQRKRYKVVVIVMENRLNLISQKLSKKRNGKSGEERLPRSLSQSWVVASDVMCIFLRQFSFLTHATIMIPLVLMSHLDSDTWQ